MKSTPSTTLVKKPGMSRVKLAMRVRPTGPLVAFIFDGKVPSKTQHDTNNVVNKDHELFTNTNQYFTVADMIRSNCLKEQFSLYALSKLEFSKQKFSKHYWYFKYLLILQVT